MIKTVEDKDDLMNSVLSDLGMVVDYVGEYRELVHLAYCRGSGMSKAEYADEVVKSQATLTKYYNRWMP